MAGFKQTHSAVTLQFLAAQHNQFSDSHALKRLFKRPTVLTTVFDALIADVRTLVVTIRHDTLFTSLVHDFTTRCVVSNWFNVNKDLNTQWKYHTKARNAFIRSFIILFMLPGAYCLKTISLRCNGKQHIDSSCKSWVIVEWLLPNLNL